MTYLVKPKNPEKMIQDPRKNPAVLRQNVIDSSFSHDHTPPEKSLHKFLKYPANRQTCTEKVITVADYCAEVIDRKVS